MIHDILLNFNWIDALILAFILRCVFVGAARGLVTEFFKFLGIIFATFITLHFYSRLGNILNSTISLPKGISEWLIFVLLWIAVVLIFKIVREGWCLIRKSEEVSGVSKLLGGLLAIFRGALVCGLVFVLIFLSGNKFLIKSARQSFVSLYLLELSPRFYDVAFEGMIVKLFPGEKKNEKVFVLFEKKTQKK